MNGKTPTRTVSITESEALREVLRHLRKPTGRVSDQQRRDDSPLRDSATAKADNSEIA